MTEIRQSNVAEYFAEPGIEVLWELYAEEAKTKSLPPHNPQRQIYEAMEQMNILHIYSAYDDGKIVGFAFLLVNVVPHYGVAMSTLESFFVHRYYRKGATATKLLRAVEAKAKELGAFCMLVSAPTGGRLEKAMPMWGYRHTNTTFMKELT